MGHIETIFDCKFKPDNPEVLATSSFDGTIKVWDITSMTPLQSSVGNESIIYCISWAPGDLDCIAAATSKQGVLIWHRKNGTIIRRFTEHEEGSVFAVAWNQKDARYIASGGGDHKCIIQHSIEGTKVKVFHHPGSVYGIDWMPNSAKILATTCEDGSVRIYNIDHLGDSPEKTFIGHTAKAFQVKWNPLKEGLLCSGSDDSSIRIWDYTSGACISILHGHLSNVRGLQWSPEIPYLLFSGSWDYTIRAWDARDGACLDAVFDHGADVYGLSIHPDKPFVLVSSSRDSTLRVWSVLSLTPLLPIYMFTHQPWSELLAFADRGFKLGVPALLCGKRSTELKAVINKDGNTCFGDMYQEFSSLFSHSWGVTNLWDLVKVLQGSDLTQLSENYHLGIVHVKHIIKVKASEAQELQMVTSSTFGQGGIGMPSRDDRLRLASEIYLQIGDLQNYCLLLCELGQWDQALAVAPAVSVEFWKKLASKRYNTLLQDENDKCVVYGLATGNIATVKEFLLEHNQVNDAYVLAAAEHGQVTTTVDENLTCSCKKQKPFLTPDQKLMRGAAMLMAEKYFCNGSPVHASCCCLAVDDVKNAILYLIRGHEIELAISVGLTLKTENEVTNIALYYLARKCERLGHWEMAIKILQLLPGNQSALWMTCARCSTSYSEQESLYSMAQLPKKDQCLQKAKDFYTEEKMKEAVQYHILASNPEAGLLLGLKLIKKSIAAQNRIVDETWEILQYLGCIRFDKLIDKKFAVNLHELLVFSSYIGALKAIKMQYYPVVGHLLICTRKELEKHQNLDSHLPISSDMVKNELIAWKIFYGNSQNVLSKNADKNTHQMNAYQQIYDQLIIKAGTESEVADIGPTIVTGSHLPTHSDTHLCYLTGERIQGPAFFLEDGHSAISLNIAYMWAKVNSFSPLGNGSRINPF